MTFRFKPRPRFASHQYAQAVVLVLAAIAMSGCGSQPDQQRQEEPQAPRPITYEDQVEANTLLLKASHIPAEAWLNESALRRLQVHVEFLENSGGTIFILPAWILPLSTNDFHLTFPSGHPQIISIPAGTTTLRFWGEISPYAWSDEASMHLFAMGGSLPFKLTYRFELYGNHTPLDFAYDRELEMGRGSVHSLSPDAGGYTHTSSGTFPGHDKNAIVLGYEVVPWVPDLARGAMTYDSDCLDQGSSGFSGAPPGSRFGAYEFDPPEPDTGARSDSMLFQTCKPGTAGHGVVETTLKYAGAAEANPIAFLFNLELEQWLKIAQETEAQQHTLEPTT